MFEEAGVEPPGVEGLEALVDQVLDHIYQNFPATSVVGRGVLLLFEHDPLPPAGLGSHDEEAAPSAGVAAETDDDGRAAREPTSIEG